MDKKNTFPQSICFYCFWGISKNKNGYSVASCHGRYIDQFSKRIKQVKIISPVKVNGAEQEFKIDLPNVEIIPLPYFNSYASSAKYFFTIRRMILANIQDVDSFYIRTFEPFSWLLNRFRNDSQVLVYHVVSDPYECIWNSMSISRLRKLIKAFVFYPEFRLILQAMKKNVISANGNVMSKKVEKWTGRYCNLLVESILEEEDYFKREDTCNGKSINLLYVGFLRPAKGLEYLLAAMKELVARHDWNINLRVVGNGEYREFLEKETGRLGLDNHVEFTGHLGIRKDLNQAYRESDIFVFPSLSESGPRVVLEAMANSLPVVSTAVGDTPFFLKDGRGIVIPPKSKSSIVDAVSLYLDNCEFRRRAIKRSFDFTRRYNLVDYVESFLELIRNSRHGA